MCFIMPKRGRKSGDSGDPGEDPSSKRKTRSSSKSPGTAKSPKSSSSGDPPLPQLPAKSAQKPLAVKPKPRGKPKKVTWEAKPENWLKNLPNNHGTYTKAKRFDRAKRMLDTAKRTG